MGLFGKDEQLEENKRAIKRLNPKFSFTGIKPALKDVPSFMEDGEEFVYATTGDFKGVCLMLVTNKRVLVLQKDPLGGGKHVLNIPLGKISDVSYEKGMVFSKLLIADGKQLYKIKQVSNDDAEAFVDSVKKIIASSTDKALSEGLHCPYCGSENVQPLGQHHKNFSIGKAVGGAVLTGGVGAVAGFLGKNTKQTDFVCMDCGEQFKR